MISLSLHIPLQAGTTRFSTPVQSTAPLRAPELTISSSKTSEIRSQKSEMASPECEMTSSLYRMPSLLSRMPSPKYRMASLLNRMTSRRYRTTSLLSRIASLLNRTMSRKYRTTIYTPISSFSSDNRQLCLNNFNYKINN